MPQVCKIRCACAWTRIKEEACIECNTIEFEQSLDRRRSSKEQAKKEICYVMNNYNIRLVKQTRYCKVNRMLSTCNICVVYRLSHRLIMGVESSKNYKIK